MKIARNWAGPAKPQLYDSFKGLCLTKSQLKLLQNWFSAEEVDNPS